MGKSALRNRTVSAKSVIKPTVLLIEGAEEKGGRTDVPDVNPPPPRMNRQPSRQ